MTNQIDIVWNSDQRQLMADMQKRQVMIEKDVLGLKKTADVGKEAGAVLTSSYRESTKEIERLGRVAETAFKKPLSPLDQHLNRMKELRVLFRMGKIDAEQFDRAQQASRKQLYSDTGVTARLAQWKKEREQRQAMQQQELASQRAAAAKSLAEQRSAAAALQLQRMTALHEAAKDERSLAAKSLAEQKAAAMSLQLQKLTALHEQQQQEKAAAAKSLAEQKKAAQSLQLQRLTSLEENKANEQKARDEELAKSRAFYAARRKFWEQDAADQEAAKAKAAAKGIKDQEDERAAQAKFYAARRKFWEEDAAAQTEQQKAMGDQVRRGLMSERELARQNFRERMRQLWDLRKQGAISQQEYTAAANQALKIWKDVSKLDMSSVWRSVPPQLTAVMTLTGSVAAGVRMVRAELENLQTKQRESATSTMTYAEAQSESVQNLDDSMTAAELDAAVMDLAKKKHISPTFVMRAASHALGARGGVAAKEAFGALDASIDFNPFNQDAANYTTTAMLQAKAARPEASFKSLLGQQKSAKIASPVVSDSEFSKYLVPGASGAKAFGDSERDFYSLAAHLGSRMGDTAGRVTGTATVGLQEQLETHPFLRDVKAGNEGSTMAKLRAIAFDKKYAAVKGTLLGEINAKSQDELVKSGGKLSTEARAYGAIALLLQGDAESWKQLEQKREEVLEPGAKAEALVDTQRNNLAGLPAQRTARAQKAVEAEGEILDLENQGAARGAVSRDALKNLLRKAGVPNIEQVMSGIQFEVGSNGGEELPASRAQDILRKYAANKSQPFVDQEGFNAYGPDALMKRLFEAITGSERRTREPTPEEKKASEALIRAAEALEAIVADEQARRGGVNVQVNVNGQGDKPAVPPAAGLQGGRF